MGTSDWAEIALRARWPAQLFALLATGIGLAVVVYAQAYLRCTWRMPRSLQEATRFFGFFLLFMAAMVGHWSRHRMRFCSSCSGT